MGSRQSRGALQRHAVPIDAKLGAQGSSPQLPFGTGWGHRQPQSLAGLVQLAQGILHGGWTIDPLILMRLPNGAMQCNAFPTYVV